MTRSELLANCHSRNGTKIAHAVILTDGVILYLAVSRPTMYRVVERLGDRHIESALSDDGFCFAAILSPQEWEASLRIVADEVEGLTFNDNREHPCHRIDDFVGMVRFLEDLHQDVSSW